MNSFKRVRTFQIELEFGSVVFWGEGKPEYPEKNLSEQRREPTTNSIHIWLQRRGLNPGHFGGRRVLSPLRHPCPTTFICEPSRLCNPFRTGTRTNLGPCTNFYYLFLLRYWTSPSNTLHGAFSHIREVTGRFSTRRALRLRPTGQHYPDKEIFSLTMQSWARTRRRYLSNWSTSLPMPAEVDYQHYENHRHRSSPASQSIRLSF